MQENVRTQNCGLEKKTGREREAVAISMADIKL